MPVAFRYTYSDYLRERGRFVESEAELRLAIGADEAGADPAGVDPDDALLLAAAIAGQRGLDDPEVRLLLARAAQSTRYPRTAAGSAAMVAGLLYWATEERSWWDELLVLRDEHPADFAVALACGDAALLSHTAPAPAAEESAQLPPMDAAAYAETALALAASQSELQAAHLLLARAYAARQPDGTDSGPAYTQSASHLRLALGDPVLPAAVISERVPDYEVFLLDEHVQAARARDAAYDEAVHRAVIDYLNRRQQLFGEVVRLEPLDYDWRPGK
jgi:hypothetical protein